MLFQTLLWMLHPPLQWTERLSARYGDTFRVRLLGPRARADPAWPTLVPRTVVAVSTPAHLRELFARSRDDFLTGQAHEFLAWHSGPDSIMVIDGPPHRAERQQLQHAVRGPILPTYERLIRDAIRRALATWPDRGTVALRSVIPCIMMDAGLTCLFGSLSSDELAHLRRLVFAGAVTSAVPVPLMVLPFMRLDLGRWSPGGRVHRAVSAFDQFVIQAGNRRRGHALPPEAGGMLDALLQLGGAPDAVSPPADVLARRARTMVAGLHTAAVASAWLCYHALQDPATRESIHAAASRESDPESAAYLEAVCKESLRLNLPFRGAFRRVLAPTTLDGIGLQAGTLVMPLVALTHRRPDLYPEPHRFRPERFLERVFSPEEYAPFGGGVRRCVGEPLVLLQLRVLLSELIRAFDLLPANQWSGLERRRQLLILPRDPLRAVLRRRTKPA